MVFYKRGGYRRSYTRRPATRFRKRTYRKKWSRSAARPTNKSLFKLKLITTLSSDGAGTYAGMITTDLVSGTQDDSNVDGLFDMVKLCAIKVKYIPALPNNVSATNTYTPLYAIGDSNSVTALASANEAIAYNNMRVKNMYRPWSYYYKFQQPTYVLNPATDQTIQRNGYFGSLNAMPSWGAIKFFSTGLTASTQYGQLIVSFYVTAKNRR